MPETGRHLVAGSAHRGVGRIAGSAPSRRTGVLVPSVDVPQPCVLIVDDTRLYRLLVSEHLQRAGYRVLEAASGEEALVVAATETPDLILLDMTMPGIGGLETCRRLKAQPTTRDAPVLFFSASGEVDRVVKGL